MNMRASTSQDLPEWRPTRARRRRSGRRIRSRGQKLTVLVIASSGMLCFTTAVLLMLGRSVASDRPVVNVDLGRDRTVVVEGVDPNDQALNVDAEDIELAEPEASTFLVTGADNGDCVNKNDPTVGARSSERSDTIMLWRINPKNDQMAILSMPRDLWVERPGGFNSRINTAYDPSNPQELIDTIALNFDVGIDHYMQIDFCAFRTIVDAVGGVSVPFDYPARDPASLLNIEQTGCVVLDGDMALSYVRSRHYRYEYPVGSGEWHTDPTSDFGRIARQQDFIRRIIAEVIDSGLYNPAVLSGLIKTNSQYVVYDSDLTVAKMLEFGNSVRTLDPAKIATYRIESYSDTVNGASIERPRVSGENMQAILEIFRGEALLADAPVQEFETTTTFAGASDDTDETSPTTESTESTESSNSSSTETTSGDGAPKPNITPSTRPTSSTVVDGVTVVDVDSNSEGIVPNPAVGCK